VLAENGDAVTLADAPLLERVDGSCNVAAKIGRRNGQPFTRRAGEHHAVDIALGGGEEYVVQSFQAHWGVELSSEMNLMVYGYSRQYAKQVREGLPGVRPGVVQPKFHCLRQVVVRWSFVVGRKRRRTRF